VATAVGASEDAAASVFIEWLGEMKASLGIPATLRALKSGRPVTNADIPALVEVAIHDTCHLTNPRKCTRDDFAHIFAAAI
jgi:alcohol dehydrogenase class IV